MPPASRYGETSALRPRAIAVNINGRRYTLTPSDFAPTRTDLQHLIQGLSLRTNTGGQFDWEIAGSLYTYAHDRVRMPTVFVADPDTAGAGRITDMHGTNWNTLDLKGHLAS